MSNYTAQSNSNKFKVKDVHEFGLSMARLGIQFMHHGDNVVQITGTDGDDGSLCGCIDHKSEDMEQPGMDGIAAHFIQPHLTEEDTNVAALFEVGFQGKSSCAIAITVRFDGIVLQRDLNAIILESERELELPENSVNCD